MTSTKALAFLCHCKLGMMKPGWTQFWICFRKSSANLVLILYERKNRYWKICLKKIGQIFKRVFLTLRCGKLPCSEFKISLMFCKFTKKKNCYTKLKKISNLNTTNIESNVISNNYFSLSLYLAWLHRLEQFKKDVWRSRMVCTGSI